MAGPFTTRTTGFTRKNLTRAPKMPTMPKVSLGLGTKMGSSNFRRQTKNNTFTGIKKSPFDQNSGI